MISISTLIINNRTCHSVSTGDTYLLIRGGSRKIETWDPADAESHALLPDTNNIRELKENEHIHDPMHR
jgi:hypothetical protein